MPFQSPEAEFIQPGFRKPGAALRLLLLQALLLSGAVGAKPVPIEHIARLPAIQSVSMSADGRQLVAIVALPGSDYQETALATWDLDNLEQGPVLTPSGEHMKFIRANALKADKLLVIGRQEWTGSLGGCGEGKVQGSTATFIFKTYLTDGSHKDIKEAFTGGGAKRIGISESTEKCLELAGTANLVSNLPLDPTKVIIQRLNALSLRGDYYLYDLASGGTEVLLMGGDGTTPGFFHPRDGKLLVRNELESVGGDDFEARVLILNATTGKFELHEPLTTRISERYQVNIVGIDEASGKFHVLTDKFSDLVQAYMYDPVSRSFDAEPLVAHPRFDIGALIFGTQPSNFMQLLGFTVNAAVPETTFTDPQLRSLHEGLKNVYPGQAVTPLAYNNDYSRLLFQTSSASQPPAYHLLLDRQRVQTLGSQRPWIDPSDIGEQRWVYYPARDGLQIPAILDLPAGWTAAAGPLPTIIHPHGGPWARDVGGWDSSGWVPFLTSRGFAVLRPQYRGSAGLGRKLWLAGDAQWGLAMQDDKDDAARWLVKEGIADPGRIAIFGYSYGGFAAAAATVRPDGPFKCAIAGAPVTDLGKLGVNWSDDRLQRILQGRTVKGMDPMEHTDQANLPVLLYVGDRDVRTPSWHAENFYKAVKDRVPARFELIPDQPHQLPWYYRHHMQSLRLIEDFLAQECQMSGA